MLYTSRMRALTSEADRANEFIFDWNKVRKKIASPPQGFALLDETLRDGLQHPGASDPPIGEKIEFLHRMEDLGIDCAAVGLPGSSSRAFDDVLRLCKEAADQRMRIRIAAAGRTVASDIIPMIEISQRTGLCLEVCAFIASSPIRQYVEAWDLELIAKRSAESIDLAVRAGLPVSYVTEDTTRSRPEVLETLFRNAIDHGAARLCLSDTTGHATPDGVRSLVEFARGVVATTGARVGIDWHGHNDRGLALANALYALRWGADRIHGTALGIGERAGNAPMELILLNLDLLGDLQGNRDMSKLVAYCETAARALHWDVPSNYPLVGRNAFRTATGVHAAAIAKALQKGDTWLADRVYSGVPASAFGRRQEIGIGFMSGSANVVFWLREHGIEPTSALVATILDRAKQTSDVLSDSEIWAILDRGAEST